PRHALNSKSACAPTHDGASSTASALTAFGVSPPAHGLTRGKRAASSCTTRRPARSASAAALEPPGPAPTTSRSISSVTTREYRPEARGPRAPPSEHAARIESDAALDARELLDVLLVLRELLLEPLDRLGQRLRVAGRERRLEGV